MCILFPLLAGCSGVTNSPPSPLARYQQLHDRLSAVTALSSLLAHDAAGLKARLRAGDREGGRRAAIRLKLDALRQENETGQAGARLDPLVRRETGEVVARYLRAVRRALSYQWWEARRLAQIADLVWRDPLFLNPQDERQLRALDAAAQRSARRAVGASGYAAWWKAGHRAAFRFTP